MKKLNQLNGAKPLNKKEQQSINGGLILPTERNNCGCIVYNGLYLEIVAVDCNTTCPDGSTPVSGLGM
ncbi:MAG: hypothetical protein AB8G15_11285 [Saprospiraceae bacterium]